MNSNNENELTYAEIYRLDPIHFEGHRINKYTDGFSGGTINRLLRKGVVTAGDLLRIKESELLETKGIGKKSIDEVNNFLQFLALKPVKTESPSLESLSPIERLMSYKDNIFCGDFSFAEGLELTKSEQACLAAMEEAFELLDYELILQAKNCSVQVLLIQQMLQKIVYTNQERDSLVEAVNQIPENRRNESVINYINIFSDDESKRDILRNIYGSDDAPIGNIIRKLSLTRKEMMLAINFAKWCAFDIDYELHLERLMSYKDNIFCGDFSFAEGLELTKSEQACLAAMEEGFELLDYELILQAKNCSVQVLLIQQMLHKIVYTNKERVSLVEAVNQIPENRRNASVINYINVFSDDESKRDILRNIYGSDDAPIGNIIRKLSLTSKEMMLAINFAKWCAFDIDNELHQLFSKVYKKNENMKIILRERSNNRTLKETGRVIGISRERVRQVELKAKRMFAGWYSRTRILSQISAIRDGDYILTSVELQEYFGQYTSEMLYLLRSLDTCTYLYDSQLDTFIVEDIDQSERVRGFVEELPDVFNSSELEMIQKDAEKKGLSLELLMMSINDAYVINGNIYHRSRMTITKICEQILKKYYKNGMHIYDEQQISEFREHAKRDFGDVSLPKRNRALTKYITQVSILCGRGRYKLYENEVISKELMDAICCYIDESEKNIFLTNTLFSVFEEKLLEEGIDNKYYLQGLMRKQLGDRYVINKDYVSKDSSVTCIYAEVVNYIKKFDHPISKKQVKDEYPGITEIVLNLSVSDPKIINLYGEYIHADKLDFCKEDIQYFKAVLETMLSKNGYCNIKDIFAYIEAENPISMRRLYILYPFSLFNVLEYLFGQNYQFSRPYIAYPEVEISHASDRMNELIRNADEITLAEINEYAREMHFAIYSILDYADQHNDTHLLKNDKELISIKESGIDENCAMHIETMILEEIDGTMLISELKSIYKFPRISIPWTEWLIYSVIKKWSDRLDVGAVSSTSSRLFRNMHPIVALKGNLTPDDIILTDAEEAFGTVDDLNHIDDLIADIITEELGDL